jgi:hypothetical protein
MTKIKIGNKKGAGSIMNKKIPLAAAISLIMSAPTMALTTEVGEVSIQLDNTVSYGIGIRTEDRNEDRIMPGNGEVVGLETSGSSYNYDDGSLNYRRGDIYTHVLKYSGDLELNYRNYGAFVRGRAYYDAAIMDDDPQFKPFNEATEDAAGFGGEILDAYIFADYDIGETPVSVRLGQQVISWGESTFIQGGINSINPVDASAFRKPGAEVKEGLLPVNMLYTSVGLTADLSMEAFYQLEWEKTRIDPCGTFFLNSRFRC